MRSIALPCSRARRAARALPRGAGAGRRASPPPGRPRHAASGSALSDASGSEDATVSTKGPICPGR